MAKEKKEPTAENPIKVSIIKDPKQMRIGIPAWIIENFRIDPKRQEFGWFVQEIGKNEEGTKIVRVVGTFLNKKQNGEKKDQ